MFDIADYSLKGLTEVRQEVSCTNQDRKRGIPGELDSIKEPTMSKVVWKDINKKWVNPTLYNPRNNLIALTFEYWHTGNFIEKARFTDCFFT